MSGCWAWRWSYEMATGWKIVLAACTKIEDGINKVKAGSTWIGDEGQMQDLVDGHSRQAANSIDRRTQLWIQGDAQLSRQQVAMVLIQGIG